MEAIENVIRHLKVGNFLGKQMDMAIEALEKQISKKITHEASLRKCCTCPNCKNVIDRFEQFGESRVRIKYNYCHFCGQKLDWE